MKVFTVLITIALLLGCSTLAYCCQRLDLFQKKNCSIVQEILEGKVVPFGPDILARDDIKETCKKIFGGFVDESFISGETREHHFKTRDGFNCFKLRNSRGEKQFERSDEQRDLGNPAHKVRNPPGTVTILSNGRHRR